MKQTLQLLLALVLLLAGCGTTRQSAKKPTYVPRFDYTPPTSQTMADSGAITFGLVAARYSEDQPWTRAWPFTQFSKNMALDFQELLIARGYRVRGSFQTADEMTYPDKKACDLILSPGIDVDLQIQEVQYEEVINLLGPNQYRLRGVAHLGGRVTLSILESLTGASYLLLKGASATP